MNGGLTNRTALLESWKSLKKPLCLRIMALRLVVAIEIKYRRQKGEVSKLSQFKECRRQNLVGE